MKILHNPRCSKSREALALIKSHGIAPEVIDYMTHPPSMAELESIIQLLKARPRDIVRVKEDRFFSLNLDLEDDEAVLACLVNYPELIERPIIIHNDRAVIARPLENLEKLLATGTALSSQT